MNHSKTLSLAGIYFFLCGISAILWPSSWYLISGIQSVGPELDGVLAVTGAMMVGLGVAGWIASKNMDQSKPVVISLISANAADALVLTYYTYKGVLPVLNGSLFIIVDIIWLLVLLRIKQR